MENIIKEKREKEKKSRYQGKKSKLGVASKSQSPLPCSHLNKTATQNVRQCDG